MALVEVAYVNYLQSLDGAYDSASVSDNDSDEGTNASNDYSYLQEQIVHINAMEHVVGELRIGDIRGKIEKNKVIAYSDVFALNWVTTRRCCFFNKEDTFCENSQTVVDPNVPSNLTQYMISSPIQL
ncbi:hypothetical protein MKW98_027732 [Papaver atlanticum]|uniref:Uncharacterized protein n=1 Tax=Papaver atlanticum TaxID=357466 RepID=A0AAD4XV76_9MAGN|nr:hypothetical protein MKW98_027732 [Papaver atlanticum]